MNLKLVFVTFFSTKKTISQEYEWSLKIGHTATATEYHKKNHNQKRTETQRDSWACPN